MTVEVCDESLGAKSFGGGAGVKEDRKLRPEVSLTPKPPPYNRPRFHRVVREANKPQNRRPWYGLVVDLPFVWHGPDEITGWLRIWTL